MTKRKRGRRPLGLQTKRRHNVVIEPAVSDKAKRIGRGNLSAGIDVAVRRFSEVELESTSK